MRRLVVALVIAILPASAAAQILPMGMQPAQLPLSGSDNLIILQGGKTVTAPVSSVQSLLSLGDLTMGPNSIAANLSASPEPPSDFAMPSCPASMLFVSNAGITCGPTYLTGNQTVTFSGDFSGAGQTAITTAVGAVNGVAYPASPATNTVPAASGAGAVAYGQLTFAAMGAVGANTVVVNPTAVAAAPTAQALSSCSGPGQTVDYVSGSGFTCNSLTGHYLDVWLLSGTSWTAPSWVTANTYAEIELLGGGGGGGSCNVTGQVTAGGGGGEDVIIAGQGIVTANTAYTIAIGAGGNAGTGGLVAGTAGGNTTFTIGASTYEGAGGAGGPACVTNTSEVAAGGCAKLGLANTVVDNCGEDGEGIFAAAGNAWTKGGDTRWGAQWMAFSITVTGTGIPDGLGGDGGVSWTSATAGGDPGFIHIILSGT